MTGIGEDKLELRHFNFHFLIRGFIMQIEVERQNQ